MRVANCWSEWKLFNLCVTDWDFPCCFCPMSCVKIAENMVFTKWPIFHINQSKCTCVHVFGANGLRAYEISDESCVRHVNTRNLQHRKTVCSWAPSKMMVCMSSVLHCLIVVSAHTCSYATNYLVLDTCCNRWDRHRITLNFGVGTLSLRRAPNARRPGTRNWQHRWLFHCNWLLSYQNQLVACASAPLPTDCHCNFVFKVIVQSDAQTLMSGVFCTFRPSWDPLGRIRALFRPLDLKI